MYLYIYFIFLSFLVLMQELGCMQQKPATLATTLLCQHNLILEGHFMARWKARQQQNVKQRILPFHILLLHLHTYLFLLLHHLCYFLKFHCTCATNLALHLHFVFFLPKTSFNAQTSEAVWRLPSAVIDWRL